MVDKTKRALRRHHRARMQRRAAKMLHQWWYSSTPRFGSVSDEWFQKNVRRHRDNMAICSCSMCANPRHSSWGGRTASLTMQERKEDERFVYELEELDIGEEG